MKNDNMKIQTWQFSMYCLAFSWSMPLQSPNIKEMAADTSNSYTDISL